MLDIIYRSKCPVSDIVTAAIGDIELGLHGEYQAQFSAFTSSPDSTTGTITHLNNLCAYKPFHEIIFSKILNRGFVGISIYKIRDSGFIADSMDSALVATKEYNIPNRSKNISAKA